MIHQSGASIAPDNEAVKKKKNIYCVLRIKQILYKLDPIKEKKYKEPFDKYCIFFDDYGYFCLFENQFILIRNLIYQFWQNCGLLVSKNALETLYGSNTLSIGNRMNASAFCDLWARVMF